MRLENQPIILKRKIRGRDGDRYKWRGKQRPNFKWFCEPGIENLPQGLAESEQLDCIMESSLSGRKAEVRRLF